MRANMNCEAEVQWPVTSSISFTEEDFFCASSVSEWYLCRAGFSLAGESGRIFRSRRILHFFISLERRQWRRYIPSFFFRLSLFETFCRFVFFKPPFNLKGKKLKVAMHLRWLSADYYSSWLLHTYVCLAQLGVHVFASELFPIKDTWRQPIWRKNLESDVLKSKGVGSLVGKDCSTACTNRDFTVRWG